MKLWHLLVFALAVLAGFAVIRQTAPSEPPADVWAPLPELTPEPTPVQEPAPTEQEPAPTPEPSPEAPPTSDEK